MKREKTFVLFWLMMLRGWNRVGSRSSGLHGHTEPVFRKQRVNRNYSRL